MSKKVFTEEQSLQKFNLFALSGLIMLLLCYILIQQIFVSNQMDLATSMFCFSLLVAVFLGLNYALNVKLQTTVSHKSVSFKMTHWHKRKHKIKLSDIESCEIVQSPEVALWHGGNISFSNETAFTFSGRNGVHVTTKNGQHYFIGSNKVEEFKQALEQVLDNDEA